MKKTGLKIFLTAFAVVLLSASLASAELVDQFAIGIRWKGWELTGDKNFVGTITEGEVSEQTEAYPTNAHMLFLFCPYGGLSFEMDYFKSLMSGDGNLNWRTFTLGVNVRYPIKNIVAPYAVLGVTYNNVSFDENNWWRYGFPTNVTYDSWMAQRPSDISAGDWAKQYSPSATIRDMKTDDSFGWVFGVGMDVFVTEHIAVNLDVRQFYGDTNVEFQIYQGDTKTTSREFTYSLDTLTYGIGIRYYF